MYQVFVGDHLGLQDRLNGAVVFGPFPNTGLAVGGLDLVFTDPDITITFSGSAGDFLTLEGIREEIMEGGFGDAGGRIAIRPTAGPRYSSTPTGGVRYEASLVFQRDAGFIFAADSDAGPYFRIPEGETITSAGLVSRTSIVSVSRGATPGHFVAVLGDVEGA